MLALSIGAALLFMAMPTVAQTAAELQRIEQIQREEQQRQQRQFELDRSRARPPANLQPDAVQRPAQRPDGPCRDIQDIQLNGVTLLLKKTQEALVKPYVGKCLGVNDIERLMGDVTAQYVNAGHIAARVYLGKQDLSAGRLELTIVEGVLKKLRIEDGGKQSISPFNTFPGLEGQPLNLRDIEQGLDQVNRLASNNATMSIEPGQAPGESELVIKNTPSQPWRVNLTTDTFGSKATGRDQVATTIAVDNPLGFNDYLSFSDRRSLDQNGGRRDSVSDSLSYNIPFGWTLLSAGVSHSTYVSTFVTTGGVDIRSNGDSQTAFVRADRVVYRDRNNLLTLSGNLTRKRSGNYLAGQYLAVSSRSLAVADVDLTLRTRVAGGVAFLGMGVSQGLDKFNALKDAPNLPEIAPRAQFQKERVSASWSRQFALATRTLDISTQISGQFSRHVLYGSEQMAIGGIYSVRGFDEDSLANDIGWMIRNEVGLTSPLEIKGMPGSWRVYAALDAGTVRGRHGDGQTGSLSGAALGVKTRLGKATLDTFAMAPLNRPADFPDARGSLHASFSISF